MIIIKIIGIDLAAKSENETGMAILNNKKMFLKTFFSTKDLIQQINIVSPDIIAIDAPLSLPQGRCCLEKECACSPGGHFRDSDKKIRKFGPVLPLTFPGMKLLTLRGMKIKNLIKKYNPLPDIIEVHPGTAQKIMGIGKNKKTIHTILNKFFDLNKVISEITDHEGDAAVAALTGLYYSMNHFKELGDPSEGTIIIPDPEAHFLGDIMGEYLANHL